MTKDDGCINCRFYDSGRGGTGLCRANPPVILPLPGLPEDSDGFWPIVLDSDWCGRWHPCAAEGA